MKRFVLILLITFLNLPIFSQSKVFINGSFVMGFNTKDLYIYSMDVNFNNTLGYELGATYQYYAEEKYFIKIGASFTNSFLNVKGDGVDIELVTYSVVVPILAGYRYKENWEFAAGASFAPYIEIDQLIKDSPYYLSTSLNLEAAYWVSNKIRIEVSYAFPVSPYYSTEVPIHFRAPIKLTLSYNIL